MANQKPLLSDLLKENPRLLEAATKAHSQIVKSIGRLPEAKRAEVRALGQMIASVRRSTEKGGEQS